MKSVLTALALGTVTLGIAACGSPAGNSGNASNTTNSNHSNTSTTNSATNTISNAGNTVANTISNAVSSLTTDSPDDFMKTAAQGGMAEVELGKLAAEKATDPEVKKFGQMMVTDHTKANEELKALAGKKKVELPADLGSHQSDLNDLKGKSGADFDKAYVKLMLDDHKHDVDAFQTQADKSADAETKAFAAKTLPTLKRHLESIQSISDRLNK